MELLDDEGYLLISDAYHALNVQMHSDHPTYGCSGWQWKDDILALCAEHSTEDVLDYGAGKGTLAQQMPWKIHQYDPAIPGIDEPLAAEHDIVACTDVLEHIEPMNLSTVLMHIRSFTGYAAFFVIGTMPAGKDLPDGRNAHLTQQPLWWWANYLGRCHWEIVKARSGKKREAIFTAIPA